jgi:helicase MOV-10
MAREGFRVRDPNDREAVVWKVDLAAAAAATHPTEAMKSVSQRMRKQRDEAEKDRNGVSITKVDFGGRVHQPGVPTNCQITISNISPSGNVLQKVEWLGSGAKAEGLSVCVVTPGGGGGKVLPFVFDGEHASIELVVQCTPRTGVTRNILGLEFGGGFSVLRYVEIEAGDRALHGLLAPRTPFTRKNRIRRGVSAAETMPEGSKPTGSGKSWVRDVDDFNIPPGFEQKIRSGTLNDEIERMQAADFSAETYATANHALLWAEEAQLKVDIREFDMVGAQLQTLPHGRYGLTVPGLAESRPSVLKGDKVFVTLHGKRFPGRACRIELNKVVLSFHHSFRYDAFGAPVDVEFTFPRTMLRLEHNAISDAHNAGDAVLNPNGSLIPKAGVHHSPDRPLQIREDRFNAAQQQAITHVVENSSGPLPYVIFGPPGIGKTYTLVQCVVQIVRRRRNGRVLVCAPSNSAADLICERLAHDGLNRRDLFRAMAYSRSVRSVSPTVLQHCLVDGDDFVVPELDAFRQFPVVVATVAMAAKLQVMLGLDAGGAFDTVAVDEAGHATEPAVLGAIVGNLKPGGQLVLAGDPNQLGPIVHSDLAIKRGLGRSLLERLCQHSVYTRGEDSGEFDPRVLTKLVENYRSHPAILELPNEMFYDGELRVAANPITTHSHVAWKHLPAAGVPLIFVGVQGEDVREESSPSWFNIAEVEQVLKYAKWLLENQTGTERFKPEHIGIIAPYAKQVSAEDQGRASLSAGPRPDLWQGCDPNHGREHRAVSEAREAGDHHEHGAGVKGVCQV